MSKIKPPGGGHKPPRHNRKTPSHHNNNPMDQVKIKRVKRNKKKATAKEKILAGLGVGGTLLGGIGAVSPKTTNTEFVRTDNQTGSGKSVVKDVLKRVFGISKAKASEGEDLPPDDLPPADQPPADLPPADLPPADLPPADLPPADSTDTITPEITDITTDTITTDTVDTTTTDTDTTDTIDTTSDIVTDVIADTDTAIVDTDVDGTLTDVVDGSLAGPGGGLGDESTLDVAGRTVRPGESPQRPVGGIVGGGIGQPGTPTGPGPIGLGGIPTNLFSSVQNATNAVNAAVTAAQQQGAVVNPNPITGVPELTTPLVFFANNNNSNLPLIEGLRLVANPDGTFSVVQQNGQILPGPDGKPLTGSLTQLGQNVQGWNNGFANSAGAFQSVVNLINSEKNLNAPPVLPPFTGGGVAGGQAVIPGYAQWLPVWVAAQNPTFTQAQVAALVSQMLAELSAGVQPNSALRPAINQSSMDYEEYKMLMNKDFQYMDWYNATFLVGIANGSIPPGTNPDTIRKPPPGFSTRRLADGSPNLTGIPATSTTPPAVPFSTFYGKPVGVTFGTNAGVDKDGLPNNSKPGDSWWITATGNPGQPVYANGQLMGYIGSAGTLNLTGTFTADDLAQAANWKETWTVGGKDTTSGGKLAGNIAFTLAPFGGVAVGSVSATVGTGANQVTYTASDKVNGDGSFTVTVTDNKGNTVATITASSPAALASQMQQFNNNTGNNQTIFQVLSKMYDSIAKFNAAISNAGKTVGNGLPYSLGSSSSSSSFWSAYDAYAKSLGINLNETFIINGQTFTGFDMFKVGPNGQIIINPDTGGPTVDNDLVAKLKKASVDFQNMWIQQNDDYNYKLAYNNWLAANAHNIELGLGPMTPPTKPAGFDGRPLGTTFGFNAATLASMPGGQPSAGKPGSDVGGFAGTLTPPGGPGPGAVTPPAAPGATQVVTMTLSSPTLTIGGNAPGSVKVTVTTNGAANTRVTVTSSNAAIKPSVSADGVITVTSTLVTPPPGQVAVLTVHPLDMGSDRSKDLTITVIQVGQALGGGGGGGAGGTGTGTGSGGSGTGTGAGTGRHSSEKAAGLTLGEVGATAAAGQTLTIDELQKAQKAPGFSGSALTMDDLNKSNPGQGRGGSGQGGSGSSGTGAFLGAAGNAGNGNIGSSFSGGGFYSQAGGLQMANLGGAAAAPAKFQGLQMPAGLQMSPGYPASEGYEQPGVAGAETGQTTYTVKKGDTLWSIAKKHYKDGKKWRLIMAANAGKVKSVKALKIGTVLVIPPAAKK